MGFAAVSVIAFSVWAFGGSWFRGRGGEPAMYAVIALVFLALTGGLLHPLAGAPRSVARFQRAFIPAFSAYAVLWSAAWFLLGGGWGEWVGALLGTLAFVWISGWVLGSAAFSPRVWGVFLVLHTVGYYAGGWSMATLLAWHRSGAGGWFEPEAWRLLAPLSWGVLYGLGFGAALGYAYPRLGSVAVQTRTSRPTEGGGQPQT